MASIFSVQNLHTFLRRKNLRPPPPPPSRGPPGPLERKGRRSPPPPLGAGRSLAPVLAGASPEGVGLVSPAMMLLRKSKSSWVVRPWSLRRASLAQGRLSAAVQRLRHRLSISVDLALGQRPTTNDQRRISTPLLPALLRLALTPPVRLLASRKLSSSSP